MAKRPCRYNAFNIPRRNSIDVSGLAGQPTDAPRFECAAERGTSKLFFTDWPRESHKTIHLLIIIKWCIPLGKPSLPLTILDVLEPQP